VYGAGLRLECFQERGVLYIGPATEVYEGMVIGNTSKGEEMVVSITVAGSDQYPWIQWVLIIASTLLILGLAIQLLSSTSKPYMKLTVSPTTKRKSK
jgi:hypothetical protein